MQCEHELWRSEQLLPHFRGLLQLHNLPKRLRGADSSSQKGTNERADRAYGGTDESTDCADGGTDKGYDEDTDQGTDESIDGGTDKHSDVGTS